MNKLNILLDDKTVLNFPYVWKLMKRYYLISLTVPLLVLSYFALYYMTQNTIQLAKNSFEYSTSGVNSPNHAISKLLGQQSSRLSSAQIVAMGTTFDFVLRLAKRAVTNPAFKELNFNSLKAKKILTYQEMFGHCQNEEKCILSILKSQLAKFYFIAVDKRYPNRYVLSVKTLDAATSKFVLQILREEIVSTRLNDLSGYIRKQEELSHRLIESEKVKLGSIDLSTLEQERNNTKSELHKIRERIVFDRKLLNQGQSDLEYMQNKLKLMNGTITKKNNDKQSAEKAIALTQKAEKLREDITALEVSLEGFGKEDKLIITQLKKELSLTERKLASMGSNSFFLSDTKVYNDKLKKQSRNIRLEYKITQGQVEKLEAKYNKSLIKGNQIEELFKEVESKLKKYGPQFEYIRKLEEKLVQLQLIQNTVISDISFTAESEVYGTYKKTSQGQVFAFALALSIFSILILVLIRFIFDAKIYDSEELMATFEGMEIIGNTPEFE